jgi:NADH pyrophosphatase NudC (nudix superfamily)
MEKSVSAIIAQAAAMGKNKRMSHLCFSLFLTIFFVVDWNTRTKFCSACGKRTISQEAGYKRNCPTANEKCISHIGVQNFAYPRTGSLLLY